MSQAEDLLNSLTPYAANDPEERFVVGSDRFITVPRSMRRIGVQGDHNVKTIPFDCPRYCDDGYDMSEMVVYIVYVLADGTPGAYIAKNVSADGDVMHFDWTIRGEVTQCGGFVKFFVCVKHTDGEGNLENHWHSEMCEEVYVSEGPEDVEPVNKTYPDIVTQLLERMMDVEAVRDLTDAAADMAIESANTATEAAAKAEEHEANAQRIADGTVDILADLSKAHKRITNTKASMSITPPEENDTSVAYVKTVPENALPYAEVISVGGAKAIESVGVNKFPYPYFHESNRTSNGVTITVNSDGSLTLNGTPTETVVFVLYSNRNDQRLIYENCTYTVSLQNSPDASCVFINSNGSTDGVSWGDSLMGAPGQDTVSFESSTPLLGVQFFLVILAKAGFLDNVTVYPMLNEGGVPLPYKPYMKDSLLIPEAIRQLDGYGEEGSYVDLRNRRFVKADGEIVDISHLLSPDNLVAVTPGGTLSIVTETGEAVPSEISWSSC